jgi:hypothetical protein
MGMENKWDDKEHKVKLRKKGKRNGRESRKERDGEAEAERSGEIVERHVEWKKRS